ncbi:U-box domain-containing protein 35, partial [Cucurbita argyrosperma subsp. sororia]
MRLRNDAGAIVLTMHRTTKVKRQVGNSIPVSQVRDDVAAAYRKEIGWQTNEKLLPYTKMFAQRKVQLDVVTLEADDVANAIIEEVTKCSISKLVIGVSSQGFFSRKLNGLSSRISALAPRHCTVYAISKGQLASIRPPDMETNVSIKDDASESSSANSYLSYSSSSVTDSSSSLTTSYSDFPSSSPSLPLQRFQALSTINQTLLTTKSSPIKADHSRCQSVDIVDQVDGVRSSSYVSDCVRTLSRDSSCKSLPMDGQSWVDEASSSGAFGDHVSCESQTDVNFELEKLRIKLRHARGMYAIAQRETIDASRKLNHLNKQRSEDARKLDEIKNREVAAKEFAREERTKREALRREAKYVKERAEREGIYRKEAETKALQDAKEKGKHENALEGPLQQYQHFQWEDIVSATSSFSEDLKLGMGAHGTVYKCSLHHTTVAVKVLHSRDDHKKTQFLQELEFCYVFDQNLSLAACQLEFRYVFDQNLPLVAFQLERHYIFDQNLSLVAFQLERRYIFNQYLSLVAFQLECHYVFNQNLSLVAFQLEFCYVFDQNLPLVAFQLEFIYVFDQHLPLAAFQLEFCYIFDQNLSLVAFQLEFHYVFNQNLSLVALQLKLRYVFDQNLSLVALQLKLRYVFNQNLSLVALQLKLRYVFDQNLSLVALQLKLRYVFNQNLSLVALQLKLRYVFDQNLSLVAFQLEFRYIFDQNLSLVAFQLEFHYIFNQNLSLVAAQMSLRFQSKSVTCCFSARISLRFRSKSVPSCFSA